jgi:ATP-binding cassette subfamily F protein uup
VSLVSLRNIGLGFGGPMLLDGASLEIEKSERICLVGRNGTGKSTLFKVLMGELQADDGTIQIGQGIRVSKLAQEVPEDTQGSIYSVVAQGLDKAGQLLIRFNELSHLLAEDMSLMPEFEKVQHELEAVNGWQVGQRIDTILSQLELDADAEFSSLSGGWKRRVLLAQTLVAEPDVLLLDEPTNHLDIKHQLRIMDQVEKLVREEQRSALAALHDVNLAARYCSHILMLSGNGKWQAGTASEMLTGERLEHLYQCPVETVQTSLGTRFLPGH